MSDVYGSDAHNERQNAIQGELRKQLLQSVDQAAINRKEWYYASASRLVAEKILKESPCSSFLVRNSSVKDCYALSMKTATGEISHSVIATSFAMNSNGHARARAYWLEIDTKPTAFETIDAIAKELKLSAVSKHWFDVAMRADVKSVAAKDVPVIYDKLPSAPPESADDADYDTIDIDVVRGKRHTLAPMSNRSATSGSALSRSFTSARVDVGHDVGDFDVGSVGDLPDISSLRRRVSDDEMLQLPLPAVPLTSVRVRLPDSDVSVSIDLSAGATAGELVAPALAKRLPVSALPTALVYSFVGLPNDLSPGFIVKSDVALDALSDLLGSGENAQALEMWESPDVLSLALASDITVVRPTVMDFGVPLDRMLRVLRHRFSSLPPATPHDANADLLLCFCNRWLQLAQSLDTQGIAQPQAAEKVLVVYTKADVLAGCGEWPAKLRATFDSNVECTLHAAQRVLACRNADKPPDGQTHADDVLLLEYHTVVRASDTELLLMRRGAGQSAESIVLRLASRSADLVASWHEALRNATMQSARRVFGVPLDELLLREGARAVLPQLVHSCVSFLRSLKRPPPGLFERAGAVQLVQLLQSQADAGRPLVLDSLDVADAHAVAALLAAFLTRLPEPPVTFAVGKLLREAQRKNVSDEEFVALLTRLPAHNADLLRFVCDYYKEVALVHWPSIAAFAKHIAGTLVRSEDDDERDTAAVSQKLAERLIRNAANIPGPRGIVRAPATRKARGRARSNALS